MQSDFLQYIVLISWGVWMWYWGRFWHQIETIRYPMLVYFINAPKWLIYLCGKPRSDGRLELAGIVFQMAMLLDLLLIPAFLVFSVALRKRGYIFFAVFSIAIALSAVIRMIVYLWQKFSK